MEGLAWAGPSTSKNGDLGRKVEMSRVRVRNTSTGNIGFSFGFLFKGQQALVEESRLSEGDKRMIASKKLVVEPETLPMTEPVKPEVVNPEPVKEEVKTNVPENKGAPAENSAAVSPAPVVVATPIPEPAVEPGPVPPVATPSVEPEIPAKPKYTEAQLKELSKKELKELSKDLGADGRSRNDMIAKILESQEK